MAPMLGRAVGTGSGYRSREFVALCNPGRPLLPVARPRGSTGEARSRGAIASWTVFWQGKRAEAVSVGGSFPV